MEIHVHVNFKAMHNPRSRYIMQSDIIYNAHFIHYPVWKCPSRCACNEWLRGCTRNRTPTRPCARITRYLHANNIGSLCLSARSFFTRTRCFCTFWIVKQCAYGKLCDNTEYAIPQYVLILVRHHDSKALKANNKHNSLIVCHAVWRYNDVSLHATKETIYSFT